MESLLWLKVSVFVLCSLATTVLAIAALILHEYGRSHLLPICQQRAKYVTLAAVTAAIPLMLLAFDSSFPRTAPLAYLLLLPSSVWICFLAVLHLRGSRHEVLEGVPEDYHSLAAKFPLTPITTQEAYDLGEKFFHQQAEHFELAEVCGNDAERMTNQHQRYLNDLNNELRKFARKYPRLIYGQDWYNARLDQISQLELIARQAKDLATLKSLQYGEAHTQLELALGGLTTLERIKKWLEGQLALDEKKELVDSWFEPRLDDLDHDLTRRIARAREALRLFEAEANGQIKYSWPARFWISRASYQADFSAAERMLKQALDQANNPDADTRILDGMLARQGLALLFHYHLDKSLEAEPLYLQVLQQQQELFGPQAVAVARTYGHLGLVCQTIGKTDEAVAHLNQQIAILKAKAPEHLSDTSRAMRQLAVLLFKLGRTAEAEFVLRDNLALCDKHRNLYRYFDFDTVGALNHLIGIYVQTHRYQEAARFVDRVNKMADSRLGNAITKAGDLRNYALIYQQVGRGLEAEAHSFEKRAKKKEEELANFERQHPSTSSISRTNALRSELDLLWQRDY